MRYVAKSVMLEDERGFLQVSVSDTTPEGRARLLDALEDIAKRLGYAVIRKTEAPPLPPTPGRGQVVQENDRGKGAVDLVVNAVRGARKA